jgi:hypothetical protein
VNNKTKAVKLAELTLLTGATGPYDGVSARPFKTGVTLGEATNLASFDNRWATFAGSAAKVVVWSEVFEDDDEELRKQSQNLLWVATAAPATPETIVGVAYFNDDVPPALVGYDLLTNPETISAQFDAIEHTATVP